jgi:hypothetical protein
MAKVEILSPVMINGDPAPVGAVVDVSDSEALYLIGQGMAAVAAVPAPEPEPEPEVKPARTRKHSPDPED